jgi:hypothetical protein
MASHRAICTVVSISRHDHPAFLMALGQLRGVGVDRAVMRRTLDVVLSNWDWQIKIWGWCYVRRNPRIASQLNPGLVQGVQ